jgi:hypothetical protein
MLGVVCVFAGILFLTTAAPAQDKAKPKKDPPGTTLIMGQLRFLFDKWDLNRDGSLDRAELAKAFRGADAQPYKGDGKAPTDATARKYPDYQFLVELDQDRDSKISQREWDDWARTYAKEQKKKQSASSRSLSKKSTPTAQNPAQAEASALKAEEQIQKQALANQQAELHYLQMIEKSLKKVKH